MSATFLGMPAFPRNAARAVGDSQLRFNLRKATRTIRGRRAATVGEVPGWEELRAAGRQIKDHTLRHLDRYLLQLEEAVTRAGGRVHWAADADEANRIVAGLVEATGETSVVKVKSMATQEIGLNEALAARGITAYETDLAELIVQLGDDLPSHILVPAIHRNRAEIREIFREKMAEWGRPAPEDLTDEPRALAEAARLHLRERFLSTKVAVSGANFMIAETGTLVVLESEGNGRMCLTLPETLISVVGIEKLLPTWQDLEVFLQLLPRSSTGERMNPYTSTWTGASEGQEFHLVLLDNGRTRVLADEVGRQALRCIRCSACLNVCPVYERVGGHAYGSVYPGPIGAILTPQLRGTDSGASAPPGGMPASGAPAPGGRMPASATAVSRGRMPASATAVSRSRMPASATAELDASLPYASSLCGACYEVCPVAIDIPEVLVHLRAKAPHPRAERLAMRAAGWVLDRPVRLARAQRLSGRLRRFVPRRLPGPAAAWTDTRDIPDIPAESFRDWWDRTDGGTR
ncbi:lactate utilization protein B [Planomonospora sp. ID91781]|uniref:lactate utilization protein B n=1 Tax=Planomonospora sp. ID91781 TaxID=2738135 RepID=UPI0018C3E7EC|nr:lactate utilization protein B [Planomonospora sp. ID91781]